VTAGSAPRLRPRGRLRLGRIEGRLSVAVVVLLVVMSLFAVRLFQVQVLDNARYGGEAVADRLRPVDLPAARGEITDDTGAVLATTVSAYDITTDPTVAGPHAAALAAALAGPLGLSVQVLQSMLTEKGTHFVYLAKQVTPAKRDQIQSIVAALATKLDTSDSAPVGGIYADADPKRIYPAGDVAGNVLGFVGSDGSGLAGLEQQQNSLLAGKAGQSTYEVAPNGQQIPGGYNKTTAAVQGTSIRLTLDQDLQYYAQSAVAAAVRTAKAQFGMAIVLDIKTMQVKAMVSVPTVNSADPTGVSQANRYNNAVSFMYEPGSVEKLLTMATLFDTGKASPLTPVTVPPTLTVANGVTIQDDSPHGTEHLTAAGVVAKSSNIGAAVLSKKLSAATLHRYLQSFGYGTAPDVGLPNEQPGILPPLSELAGNTYTKPEVAYGQSVSVTALQMAAAVASLFNGGVYRAPSLIAGTTSSAGVYTPATAPAAHRVVSPKAAAEVVNEAEMVTQAGGTASNVDMPGYVVAGKTGTAQYAEGGTYRGYTTSFIGTAPADNPQYLVYVVIQKPTVGPQTGDATAMPAWRQIMTYLLATEHIPPTGAKPARLPLTTSAGG
jgi:cell division protein FtsI (penicillin-binding protein 3)